MSLVTTAWLAAHLHDPHVRIVDTRWHLLDPRKGERDYRDGHIPNAIHLSVDHHLTAPPLDDARTGRHPLPLSEAFAETMARAGVSSTTRVVAYDDVGGANAARVWWLLKYFGHESGSLLDGGWQQWLAEGRPISTDVPNFPRAEFHAHANPNLVVTKEEMIALTRELARRDPQRESNRDGDDVRAHTLILDARAPERYQGKTEPIDPRAGHIPGAKNAPGASNLRGGDDFRFRDANALRQQYDALGANGARQIVAYCGSGVNACADLFALQLAGYDHLRLYAGSFSEWSRDPELPVITGKEPF